MGTLNTRFTAEGRAMPDGADSLTPETCAHLPYDNGQGAPINYCGQ